MRNQLITALLRKLDWEQLRPKQPTVIDNDEGEITVELNGEELRGWSYKNDDERRTKMLCAREYVEGWCDASEKIFSGLDTLDLVGTSRNIVRG